MKKALSYEFVKSYIENEGYTLLSNEYSRAKEYLEVRCPTGHVFSITWDAFKGSPSQKGRRCAKCSNRKVELVDVINYAKSRGYKLLSQKYINAKTKMDFECPFGHTFPMTWDNFKNNNRSCPECQGLRRWSIEEVRKYFSSRGYTLLTSVYLNVTQRLKYRCPKGHISYTNFNKFKNEEHGCDNCGGSKKLELSFVKAEFAKAGLVLLEKEYKNAGTPMWFICPCGNIDKVDYRRFKWSAEGKNPKRKCSKCMIPDWYYTLNEEERIKERKYPEYHAWVKKVKERDEYTCKCCNYKGDAVNAHHLDGYSWCKEKRTDIENGVTLCSVCHSEFHQIYGFKMNTKEQYFEFWSKKYHTI